MQVFCLTSLDELAPYADDWDRLSAGVPFRSWAWLSTWWRHYGGHDGGEPSRTRLLVLGVFDRAETLVGLAPWYVDCRGPQGRVVRLLGSGEVCSDYLGVLCQPEMEHQVAWALADYLSGAGDSRHADCPRWDLLELQGVDAEDPAVGQLLKCLAERGHTVHRRAGPNCWRIELPAAWDDYLALLSKGHRSQMRRLERNVLGTGRAVLHSVGHAEELPRAVEILIDLHQRRHRVLGRPGCFASPRFAAFHREVMPEMLRSGQLQLHWLELDGRPAAAEYYLAGGGVIYAYQSGIDPESLDQQPGRLAILAMLRWAIEQGYRAFDLLRGDEPYKAHLRARPRGSLAVRVVPQRPAAQLRHNLWLAGRNVKQWIKRRWRLAGTRRE